MARKALPKLSDLSVTELQALRKRVDAEIDARREGAKADLLSRMRKEAEALGLSFEEVVKGARPRQKRSDAGIKLKPKYIGPKGETYGGRGPTPAWLKALEARGHKREKYLAKK